ncbi:MAG: DUF4112 domain-containing protein [Pseudomonadota bacterium]|nr:DUF4112 domain-containing protein [Pseudomonadota bacterium]
MIDKAVFSRRMFEQLQAGGVGDDNAVRRMEFVAQLLDSAFVLPGTNKRIGIDAIIGMVPGIGDVVTTVLSSYVIWEARNLGVSRVALGRMLANLAIHASVGSIPIIGDVFDAFFRVNQRNMRIVHAQLRNGKNRRPAARTTITVP